MAEWNATKINHGKDEMKCNVYFLSKIMGIYLFLFSGSIGSKLIYHGKVLLRNLIFYIVYVSGSEMSDIDRRRYEWDNLFWKSSVVKEYGGENLVVSKVDRRIDREIILLVIERAKK